VRPLGNSTQKLLLLCPPFRGFFGATLWRRRRDSCVLPQPSVEDDYRLCKNCRAVTQMRKRVSYQHRIAPSLSFYTNAMGKGKQDDR
jgi:hypothetical protein